MTTSETFRQSRIDLAHGSGAIPVVGFGTLIPDLADTKRATKTALEVGFRHLDCAERYGNEQAVGEAIREAFGAGTLAREDLFVTTKLWNTNHRPERVKPAFDASRQRLQIDYVDCYLIHTPYAFAPGDDPHPVDDHGQVIYDEGVTLADTWGDWNVSSTKATAARSVYRMSLCRNCARSLRWRGSSRRSCRSNRIRIYPSGSCSTSANNKELFCWRSQRWAIR